MSPSLLVSVTVITLMVFSSAIEGKRITLMPLSGDDVYRMLRMAGREDAIPEGRAILKGIAAIKLFTLGLVKGIGSTFLRAQNQALTTLQAQQICFNSRSLNEINDDAGDDGNGDENDNDYAGIDYDEQLGRQAGTTGTGTATVGTNSPTTTNTNTGTALGTNTASVTTTGTGANAVVTCVVVQRPVAAAAATAAPAVFG